MQTRDFNLKVKALSEEGAFEGVASPYGEPADAQGDVIEPGAYNQAIAQQGRGYPLLFSHQQDQPIGLAKIADSNVGLLVHGQLLLEDPAAQRVHAHLKMGSLRGLSIGYLPASGEGKITRRNDGTRVLKEIKLYEISVVAVPAAERAQVTSVKTLGDVRHVLLVNGLVSYRCGAAQPRGVAEVCECHHRVLQRQQTIAQLVLAFFHKFHCGLLVRNSTVDLLKRFNEFLVCHWGSFSSKIGKLSKVATFHGWVRAGLREITCRDLEYPLQVYNPGSSAHT